MNHGLRRLLIVAGMAILSIAYLTSPAMAGPVTFVDDFSTSQFSTSYINITPPNSASGVSAGPVTDTPGTQPPIGGSRTVSISNLSTFSTGNTNTQVSIGTTTKTLSIATGPGVNSYTFSIKWTPNSNQNKLTSNIAVTWGPGDFRTFTAELTLTDTLGNSFTEIDSTTPFPFATTTFLLSGFLGVNTNSLASIQLDVLGDASLDFSITGITGTFPPPPPPPGVPEPASLTLWGLVGLGSIGLWLKRRRATAA